jgi:threonine dehydratase
MAEFDNNVDGNEQSLLWGSMDIVTLDELHFARDTLKCYQDVKRTPQLTAHTITSLNASITVDLKLESLQTTGSFKIRGMRYKLHVSDIDTLRQAGVVTMSAGNAGKAISYLAKSTGINAKVFMPSTAPVERKQLMESMGATVVQVSGEELLKSVEACIQSEGRILVHPFDDVDIIRGHASCGLEILEDAPDAVSAYAWPFTM